ncbi:MAG: radical SAM protein [Candidatus Omnitrophota bacterium]
MKVSRYNTFVYNEIDEVYLGYNAVSGGLYVFNEIQYREIEKILKDPNDNKTIEILKKKLIDAKFLIDEDFDEISFLKLKNRTARFNSNGLALVITPTLNCNFNCPYCYVDREKITMSPETVNRVKNFFDLKLNKIDKASVCWTGGEPLIALAVVEELTNHFRIMAGNSHVEFESSLITNGFLLNSEIIDRLLACGITNLQVTLDGFDEFHNRYRSTKSGEKTFSIILKNIVEASNRGLKVIVRSNIEKINYESVFKLIDTLAESGLNNENILVAPCPVMDVETSKGHYCGNCFNGKEFSALEPHILSYAVKKGFKINKSLLSPINTFCGANTASLFVIDAYANILKCWCNLGRSDNNKVGSISEDGKIQPDNLKGQMKWMSWDPFDIPECKNCDVLPICMGGCMYYNVMGETDSIDIGCSLRKYNLNEILKLYYSFCKERGDKRLENFVVPGNLPDLA